jgi:hypothetical protein
MLGNCFFIQGAEYTGEPVWEGEKGVGVVWSCAEKREYADEDVAAIREAWQHLG